MAPVSNVWVTPPSLKLNKSDYTNGGNEISLSGTANEWMKNLDDKKWFNSLKEFHHNRCLEISHIGQEVTEKVIRDALPFLEIKQFITNKSTGSVHIIPTSPSMLDPLLNNWELPEWFETQQVKIRFSNTDDFLCICNLPLSITHEQFQGHVEKFGPVERSFLIYDCVTDHHKGFGLVQYGSREVACQAKNLLHRNVYDSNELFCDWLDHKVVTYSDLYSKCLYIENLPLYFRNLGNLRASFSKYSVPIYCQIGVGRSRAKNFALVEYGTHACANTSKEKLDGMLVDGSAVAIHFAIPGRSAVKLYGGLVTEKAYHNKNGGLLPIPQILPFPSISTALQSNVQLRNRSVYQQSSSWSSHPYFQYRMPLPCLPNVPFAQTLTLPTGLCFPRLFNIQNVRANVLNEERSLRTWGKGRKYENCESGNVKSKRDVACTDFESNRCGNDNLTISIAEHSTNPNRNRKEASLETSREEKPLMDNDSASQAQNVNISDQQNSLLNQALVNDEEKQKTLLEIPRKDDIFSDVDVNTKVDSSCENCSFSSLVIPDLSVLSNQTTDYKSKPYSCDVGSSDHGSNQKPKALLETPRAIKPFTATEKENIGCHILKEVYSILSQSPPLFGQGSLQSPLRNTFPENRTNILLEAPLSREHSLISNPSTQTTANKAISTLNFQETLPSPLRGSMVSGLSGLTKIANSGPMQERKPPFNCLSIDENVLKVNAEKTEQNKARWLTSSGALSSNDPSNVPVMVDNAKKRKFHYLLPTPEASPETGVIGQHSQGLGGHYADSYKKFRAAHI